MPKISVIIPVYNTEKYLRECLDSVINQTFKDIEIICVNDGSTDNSLEILNEYGNKYNFVKIISYSKNRGAGFARNKALDCAKGEYLAFLDSDDLYTIDVLEKIYLKAKKYDAEIGICSARSFDDLKNEYVTMPWALRTNLLPNEEVFSPKDVYNCLFNFSQNWNWNKIFKAIFIQKNKVRFQNIHRTNDLLFTCKALMLANKITVLNEPLVNYRINNSSSCQHTNDNFPLDFYLAFRELKNWLVYNKFFYSVKSSFIEWALAGCVYNINSIKNKQIQDNLKKYVFTKGLKEFNLLEHKSSFIIDITSHKDFDIMLADFRANEKALMKNRIQNIFSMRNIYNNNCKTHKVITIFGLKIKINLRSSNG